MDNLRLRDLWKEFWPISMSDMVMALGDPTIALFLAMAPHKQSIALLAAFGLAKGLAVFCESPIIMILHASNALTKSQPSRAVLKKLAFILGFSLSLSMALISVVTFLIVEDQEGSMAARLAIILCPWPILIAVRRLYQGQLISLGLSKYVAQGSVLRLFTLVSCISAGIMINQHHLILTGLSLLLALLVELVFILKKAQQYRPQDELDHKDLPKTLHEVWHYYYPLIWNMISLWGARLSITVLLAISNKVLAAVWTSGWALTISGANGVRMLQQLIIRHRRLQDQLVLKKFVLIIGFCFSILFLLTSYSDLGYTLIKLYASGKEELAANIRIILFYLSPLPLLMAIQNMYQGIMIRSNKTKSLGYVTLASNILLLLTIVLAWLTHQLSIGWIASNIIICLLIEIMTLLLLSNRESPIILPNLLKVN